MTKSQDYLLKKWIRFVLYLRHVAITYMEGFRELHQPYSDQPPSHHWQTPGTQDLSRLGFGDDIWPRKGLSVQIDEVQWRKANAMHGRIPLREKEVSSFVWKEFNLAQREAGLCPQLLGGDVQALGTSCLMGVSLFAWRFWATSTMWLRVGALGYVVSADVWRS